MMARQDDLPRPTLPVDALDNISLYLDVIEEGPIALFEQLRMLYRE
jgi:hypothetical protein